LLAIRSNGADPIDGLLEVSVDWTFAYAIEALEFTRCPQVISLKVEVQSGQWDDQCGKGRCRRRDDDQGKGGCISDQQFPAGCASSQNSHLWLNSQTAC